MADLSAADQFALEWTESFIDLNSLNANTRRRVASMLRILLDDLVDEINAADLESIGSETLKRRRTEKLIRSIRKTVDLRYKQAATRMRIGGREVSRFMYGESIDIINKVFTVDIASATITVLELVALADENVVLGDVASSYWGEQSQKTRTAFARQMRQGVLAGESNKELVQRIRGKATGKTISIETAGGRTLRVRQFDGGVMGIASKDADMLVRTSAQSISNEALLKTYEDNANILKGYRALTTLDSRTSHICIARTGAGWDLEGNPLPDSATNESFPGPPPWHFFCRTILSPVTKTWGELTEEATGEKKKLLDTVPNSQRASMDGLISTSKVNTFGDWLRIKGDTFARAKLGPGRFDLWKSGKITLSQLIDQAGNPRNLAQLRAL